MAVCVEKTPFREEGTMKRQRTENRAAAAPFVRSKLLLPTLLALSTAGLFIGGEYFQTAVPYSQLRSRNLAAHDDPKRDDSEDETSKHATSYSQRHPNYYNTNRYHSTERQSGYYSYYEDDDQLEEFRQSYHHGKRNTDLTDVFLCLMTALGWAVWMISSALSSKQAAIAAAGGLLCADEGGMDERFWQRDNALLVHGNVLQVSKLEDANDGLTIYRAVIDYVIKSEQTQESLQIRKHFDTSQELEQGFANVELLVLPEEPTHSILKEDYEEQMLQARTIDEENVDELLSGSHFKRLSTALAAFLVLASLMGTTQVVYLMEPELRWQGWLSLCIGVALLLPCAVLLHKFIKVVAAYQEPSEKHGIVIDGNLSKPEPMLTEACMPASCCCEDERQLTEVASYIAPETSGCYFIRYNKKATDVSDAECSIATEEIGPSTSSISSISENSPTRGQVLWQSGSMDSL